MELSTLLKIRIVAVLLLMQPLLPVCLEHAPYWQNLTTGIDLALQVGEMCVPAVNLKECSNLPNVNMVTCGGQASIPIAFAIGKTQGEVGAIEVVSIASRSGSSY